MKKRSAMTVAAGLVAALLAGSIALSVGFTGGGAASAGSGDSAPRVRTIERTITIHKKAKEAEPVVRTIAAPVTQQAAASAATSGSDDDPQDGGFGDDGFEDEHEGDDQVGQDHEDDGQDHEDDGGGEDD